MNNKFEIGKDVAIKYIMFKKRTEKEVINKLEVLNYSPNIIDKIIDYLKETDYINDERYVNKYFEELKKVKNWSVRHVKQDLYNRGCECTIPDNDLMNYEIQSIKNLYGKYKVKYPDASEEETQEFIKALRNKGFMYDNIKKIIV